MALVLSQHPSIQKQVVLDRTLAAVSKQTFGINRGAILNNFFVLPATSVSNTQQQWSNNTNTAIFIGKEWLVQETYDLTFTCSVPGSNGLCLDLSWIGGGSPVPYSGGGNGLDAPSQFPCNQSIQTATLKLNNAQTTLNNYAFVNILPWTNIADEALRIGFSLCPSMLDNTCDYSDVYTTPGQIGVANSPLQSWGQVSVGANGVPRGSWAINVITNTSSAAHIQFTTTEPLFFSCLNSGKDDGVGFIGVQNFNLTLQTANLTNVLWSHSNASYASNAVCTSATILTPANLLLSYVTPPTDQQLPQEIFYTYTGQPFWSYNNAVASLAPMTSVSGQMFNSQTFDQMPKRILIFVTDSPQNRSITTSNVPGHRIDSVSISLNNVPNQLADASTQQLWKMSRDAGSKVSYQQWNNFGGFGSLLILDVGTSLYITEKDQAPGVSGKVQFSARLGFTNLSTIRTTNPVIQVIAFNDGLFRIGGAGTQFFDSVLVPRDVANLSDQPVTSSYYFSPSNWFGSSLIDSMKAVGAALLGGETIGGRRRKSRHREVEFDERGGSLEEDEDDDDEIKGGAKVENSRLQNNIKRSIREKINKLKE